jgi:hypothetical protein
MIAFPKARVCHTLILTNSKWEAIYLEPSA